MSFSTAKASISGSSVVPGLPNTIPTPSCFSRSRKARLPDITGTGVSRGLNGVDEGASSRLLRPLAVRDARRAGLERDVGMIAHPGRADGRALEYDGRAPVALEFRAVLVDAGRAEDRCAHRHQPVGRHHHFERGQVVTVILDAGPDLAPLVSLQRLARGHHLDL